MPYSTERIDSMIRVRGKGFLNRNQLALANCTTQTLVMNTQSVFQSEISW